MTTPTPGECPSPSPPPQTSSASIVNALLVSSLASSVSPPLANRIEIYIHSLISNDANTQYFMHFLTEHVFPANWPISIYCQFCDDGLTAELKHMDYTLHVYNIVSFYTPNNFSHEWQTRRDDAVPGIHRLLLPRLVLCFGLQSAPIWSYYDDICEQALWIIGENYPSSELPQFITKDQLALAQSSLIACRNRLIFVHKHVRTFILENLLASHIDFEEKDVQEKISQWPIIPIGAMNASNVDELMQLINEIDLVIECPMTPAAFNITNHLPQFSSLVSSSLSPPSASIFSSTHGEQPAVPSSSLLHPTSLTESVPIAASMTTSTVLTLEHNLPTMHLTISTAQHAGFLASLLMTNNHMRQIVFHHVCKQTFLTALRRHVYNIIRPVMLINVNQTMMLDFWDQLDQEVTKSVKLASSSSSTPYILNITVNTAIYDLIDRYTFHITPIVAPGEEEYNTYPIDEKMLVDKFLKAGFSLINTWSFAPHCLTTLQQLSQLGFRFIFAIQPPIKTITPQSINIIKMFQFSMVRQYSWLHTELAEHWAPKSDVLLSSSSSALPPPPDMDYIITWTQHLAASSAMADIILDGHMLNDEGKEGRGKTKYHTKNLLFGQYAFANKTTIFYRPPSDVSCIHMPAHSMATLSQEEPRRNNSPHISTSTNNNNMTMSGNAHDSNTMEGWSIDAMERLLTHHFFLHMPSAVQYACQLRCKLLSFSQMTQSFTQKSC